LPPHGWAYFSAIIGSFLVSFMEKWNNSGAVYYF
jgi:hypothetical protein